MAARPVAAVAARPVAAVAAVAARPVAAVAARSVPARSVARPAVVAHHGDIAACAKSNDLHRAARCDDAMLSAIGRLSAPWCC